MNKSQANYPPKNQRYSSTAGLPPGTLKHVGKQVQEKTRITVIEYNNTSAKFKEIDSVEECAKYAESDKLTWINIDGLFDTELIEKIGEDFNIHPLILEDVVNTRQRPKTEEYEELIFVSMKMLGISEDGSELMSEQISFVSGSSWVISFQEQEGDVFDGLRKRILNNKGLLRKYGSDFLLYRLVDTVVDNYFFVAEYFEEELENLEEKVLSDPSTEALQEIQHFKRQIIQVRRAVSPLREVLASLEKNGHLLIKKATQRYLRDVYEHIIQLNEAFDSQRDILSGITDLHSSGVSNRMNQVMQLLTIIATIFIPLTFIAGIYGMNFETMPELKWEYGYFYVWIVIVAIFVGMLYYFKRKKWL